MRGHFALTLCVAALSSGCSLLYPVDPGDVMTPDGGVMDAGPDAAVDAGPDADIDAGPDGGTDAGGPQCVVRQAVEVSCQDGIDNDCMNGTDCADTACRGTAACCESDELFTLDPLVAYTAWTPGPGSGGPGIVGDDSIVFQTPVATSLFNPGCLSLASGARFEAQFEVGADGSGDDFASLVFTSSTPPPTSPVPVDLAVRFGNDGRIHVLRAERELAMAETMGAGQRNLFVDLTPGVDEFGVGTLDATVRVVFGANAPLVLLDHMPFMPLADLIACPAADGLHVGFEGANTGVSVISRLQYEVGECSTPRQFFPLEAEFDAYIPDGPFPGGSLGEPALAHVLTGDRDDRFELWLDVASGVRADEDFAPFPLALLGGFDADLFGAPPTHRDSIAGPDPYSREPSILYPRDGTGQLEGSVAFYAFAEEVMPAEPGAAAKYGVQVGQIGLGATASREAQTLVLDPRARTDCYSYRDPSLVRVSVGQSNDFMLFYTCEHGDDAGDGRDTIGVARVTFDAIEWTLGETDDRLLASVSGYASRGVFSPEAILEPTGSDPSHRLRVYYLARNSPGRIQVALAEGSLAVGDALPSLNPVAANPILGPTSPELGPVSECSLGCFIQSIGVAETVAGMTPVFADSRLDNPHYLILVDRARHEGSDVVTHELIPLLQTRPNP